jgi:two-component system NarL family sensor kinase
MPEDYREIQEGLTGYVKLGTVIFLTLAGLFVFFIGMSIQRRRKMIVENKEMKIKFDQELLQTQLEIQEQTLKTISEEIHDNVGQILSLAKLNLNTLDNTADKKIQDTKNLVSKAINDLRNLSRSIHGDRIAQLGLQQSIEDELNILQNSGQFTTALKIVGNNYKLEPQKEMVLFRIVQEALNNAIKYSKAKNITVQLNYQPELFSLTISDDGIGFNVAALPATKTGIGLTSMQNRAALIGGVFSITSAAENGTVINIELKKLIPYNL